MNQQGKKSSKSKNVIVSLVLLIILLIIGNIIGIFSGINDIIAHVHFSLNTLISLILEIVFVILVANVLLIISEKYAQEKGRIGTLATVITSLIKYGAAIVIFCWSLSIIGVNVSTIFASLGIVALILGFGAESLIADMVTGVFILFENQYNKGDIIEVSGFRGTVQEIGIRTLSIVDAGGNIKIINNSELKDIVNRSNQRSVSICEVDVSYNTDLEELEKKIPDIISAIKEKHENDSDDDKIFIGKIEYLGVEKLGESGVTLKFVADVEEKKIFSGKRLLNREIKIAFDKAGISIPFPQIDVHNYQ